MRQVDQDHGRLTIAIRDRDRVTIAERDELLRQIRESLRTDVREFPDSSVSARKARVARAAEDFWWFCRNYLPHYPWDDPCELHDDLLHQFEVPGRHMAAIAAPREHGKTVLLRALALRAILLGQRWFLLIIQDTETLASDWIEFLKIEMEANPRIRQDFGDLRTEGHWEASDLRTSTGIRILARGRRQQVRGLINGYHRPDMAVVDDLDTPDNSRNPDIMRKTAEWLIRDVYGALSKQADSLLIDVGNIVDPRCSIALLMDHIERTRKIYDGLPESERSAESLYYRIYRAETDDIPLWPAHYTMSDLSRLRASMGSVAYSAEMLNNPIDPDGVFREEWLREFDELALEGNIGPVVIAWDASMGESRKADRQAIAAVMLCKDKVMRVIDIFDRRASIEEAIKAVYQFAEAYRPQAVCVEDVTFQALLARLLDSAADDYGYRLPIRRVKHRLSKAARIESLSSLIERGLLQFDFSRRDGTALHDELLGYPRQSAGDDGIDAVETAVNQLRHRATSAQQPIVGGRQRAYIQRRPLAYDPA